MSWPTVTSDPELAFHIRDFAKLFRGYPKAYGIGTGGWVHKPADIHTFAAHVMGNGPGLGIGPLLPDGTCNFAAIDLDEPNFDLAAELAGFLPGWCWIERSRSGNAHIIVFFSEPIEAWIPRAIMREALVAFQRKDVEVFPKSDFLREGMVGNYLNLPYFGDTRPMVGWKSDTAGVIFPDEKIDLARFVRMATMNRNSPHDWRVRASWLDLKSPAQRENTRTRQHGSSPDLHRCAKWIIEHRDTNPVTEGHRAAVYFALSCMLSNWSEIDDEEAIGMMTLVNEASPNPIPEDELARIYANAVRGQFTATRCDDPLVLPYRDPDCPIGQ